MSYHGPSSHGSGWLGWLGYPLAPLLTRYASRTICVSDEIVRHIVQDWRGAAKRARRPEDGFWPTNRGPARSVARIRRPASGLFGTDPEPATAS